MMVVVVVVAVVEPPYWYVRNVCIDVYVMDYLTDPS